jgi:dTDP-4-amino-4,6-dideoxygalactose transaminase
VATTSSLVWEGLEPVFADIDPGSLNISPEEIEKAVTDRTSAVVPVHIFGNACEVEAIREIARAHSLKVIYDASHAFGVKYQGRSILNFGDISTLSFHATKLFHTIEGGAIVTSDREVYEKAQAIINFGYTGEYDIACLGINAKMNEFEAAMGLCMLDRIDERIQERKAICELYDSELPSLQRQVRDAAVVYNYSYYPVIFEKEEQILKVIDALNQAGIYPRRYFYPSLDTLPYLEGTARAAVSRDISTRILCLPLYADLPPEKAFEIAGLVRKNL